MITQNDIDTIMQEIEEADGNVSFIDEPTQDINFEPLSLFDIFYLIWYGK